MANTVEIDTIQDITITLVPLMARLNTELIKAIDNLNFEGLKEEIMDL